MRHQNPQQNLATGNFRIVEASSSSEAKRRGVEELVLDGKGIAGKTMAENLERAKVELYKGSW